MQIEMMSFIDLKRQQKIIREKIKLNIDNVLDHGQYIMGPEVAVLEQKLCEYTGSKHCISVANGTEALLISLMALDVKPGDQIITSPFTFVANSEMISLLGAEAIYVDIDENTYNLNPNLLEYKITKKTKAIMPISLYGQCANITKINEIAGKYNIPVIEDAAQSFGSTHFGKKSGNLTAIGCTSFFPSKPLGCYGDGGACFTNNSELANRIQKIRLHGQKSRYFHTEIGINGRLDTLQAAILLAKLEIFEEEVNLRNIVANEYNRLLEKYVNTPYIEKNNTSIYAQYTIRHKNRDKIAERLKNKGIPTAIHYPIPVHLQPAYKNPEFKEGSFPISENAANEVISLPFHPYLNKNEIQFICDSIINILGDYNDKPT
jgi:UDP-2-acetamido-2-deoxy-ribo-hexuluronate aminotransferase